MTPANARATLLAQHDGLRVHIADCVLLAGKLRSGEVVNSELSAALGSLREALADHNYTETRLVRTLLHGPAAWGSLLIDRMLDEHIGEHVAFARLLVGTDEEVAARIDDFAEEIDAHMAAEERTVLSPNVLEDDVLRRRMCEESE